MWEEIDIIKTKKRRFPSRKTYASDDNLTNQFFLLNNFYINQWNSQLYLSNVLNKQVITLIVNIQSFINLKSC